MGSWDENRSKETSPRASSRQQFTLWWTLLETAIQTPSPHNVQPWRIRLLSEREAELYIDGQRTLPKEDTTGSFILSAMGMFVEAIALLAAPRGFNLEYELLLAAEWLTQTAFRDIKTDLVPFARLHLSPQYRTTLLRRRDSKSGRGDR